MPFYEENIPDELKSWKIDAEQRQFEDLKVTEQPAIRKFFDRLPKLLVNSSIEPNDFEPADWLLILFLDSRKWTSDRDMPTYVSWLNSNGIKTKTAGIETDGNCKWYFTNLERRYNNLANIVSFEDDGFYQGDCFEALCEDLYNIDSKYNELILDELKAKYR